MKTLLVTVACTALLVGCAAMPVQTWYGYGTYSAPYGYAYGAPYYDSGSVYYDYPGYYYGPGAWIGPPVIVGGLHDGRGLPS